MDSSSFGKRMMEKLGWKEGQGLGKVGSEGAVEPIKVRKKSTTSGLGFDQAVADTSSGNEALREQMRGLSQVLQSLNTMQGSHQKQQHDLDEPRSATNRRTRSSSMASQSSQASEERSERRKDKSKKKKSKKREAKEEEDEAPVKKAKRSRAASDASNASSVASDTAREQLRRVRGRRYGRQRKPAASNYSETDLAAIFGRAPPKEEEDEE